MIVTRDFVSLNFPKTGSTFVRTAIKSLYGVKHLKSDGSPHGRTYSRVTGSGIFGFRELHLPNLWSRWHQDKVNQHGTVSQIPDKYRDRPIVMVVRDPVDRFLSIYHFGDYKTKITEIQGKPVADVFPDWPDISIDAYFELQKHLEEDNIAHYGLPFPVGSQSIHFIQMVFFNPREVLGKLDSSYIDEGLFKTDMPNARFLPNENLNDSLCAFLIEKGYPRQKVEALRGRERVQPKAGTSRKTYDVKDLLSDEQIARIRSDEAVLIRMLQHFGIDYGPAPALPGRSKDA